MKGVVGEGDLKDGRADVEAGEEGLAAESNEGSESHPEEEDEGDGVGAGLEEGRCEATHAGPGSWRGGGERAWLWAGAGCRAGFRAGLGTRRVGVGAGRGWGRSGGRSRSRGRHGRLRPGRVGVGVGRGGCRCGSRGGRDRAGGGRGGGDPWRVRIGELPRHGSCDGGVRCLGRKGRVAATSSTSTAS